MDSIRGTIYLIGYLEQQSDCEKDVKGMPNGEPQNDISVKEEERNLSYTEADVLRMAQQMALEYQEEDGELLDHKGDDYAAVALKDGHIAVACWENNPWWQYMAVVEAQTYQEEDVYKRQLPDGTKQKYYKKYVLQATNIKYNPDKVTYCLLYTSSYLFGFHCKLPLLCKPLPQK